MSEVYELYKYRTLSRKIDGMYLRHQYPSRLSTTAFEGYFGVKYTLQLAGTFKYITHQARLGRICPQEELTKYVAVIRHELVNLIHHNHNHR